MTPQVQSTARERFLQTLDFHAADPPFVTAGGYFWEETKVLWRQQGWDGRGFDQVFGTDSLLAVDVWYGPQPSFPFQLIEEDAGTRTFMDGDGIIKREFKEHRDTSMPQFIKFPVETEDDFDRLERERLGLNVQVRFTEDWKRHVARCRDSGMPRRCWANIWGGFFGPLREMMGLEGLCIAFYEQPRLIERMMTQRAEAIIAITEETLRHTEFETFWFWEDMAYNHGSLIDPQMFRRFALPHYRRVCDWLHSRGIRHIGLDSDGDIRELIPVWLEAGIDWLWPFEVNSGMDVVEIRRLYGHNLIIGGGIDKKTVAIGGETMRREVDRVMPLVADGGYIPELDHGAPPDITWPRFCEYMEYLMERLRRG